MIAIILLEGNYNLFHGVRVTISWGEAASAVTTTEQNMLGDAIGLGSGYQNLFSLAVQVLYISKLRLTETKSEHRKL